MPADRLAALAADDNEGDGGGEPSALALIKSLPGNMSLESMLAEIGKLDAVRAAGLPDGLFCGIAPKVIAAWRACAAVEAPSHLRTTRRR